MFQSKSTVLGKYVLWYVQCTYPSQTYDNQCKVYYYIVQGRKEEIVPPRNSWRYTNPISTMCKGADYAHQITTSPHPLGFSNLPTALQYMHYVS